MALSAIPFIMASHSWVCSMCHMKGAECFCTCTGAQVLLCDTCYPVHYQKNKVRKHATFPISALIFRHIPGYFERMNARALACPLVREQVLKALATIDCCKAELVAKTETLLAELTRQCKDYVELLQMRRQEIELALKCVEMTLIEDEPILLTTYERILRKYVEKNIVDFTLFEYQLTETSPESLLFLNMQDEPFAFIDLKEYPCFYYSQLKLYNLSEMTCTNSVLSRELPKGTTFCLLDCTSVLCMGGSPATTNVLLFQVPLQQFTELQSTHIARAYSGTVRVDAYVYVFGSYNPHSPAVEKFSVKERQWTQINPMNAARCCFFPGVHLREIYLTSPYPTHNRSIEVFNTVKDTYRTLPFQLPASIDGYVSAFVKEGVLFVIADSQLARWKVGSHEEMSVSAVKKGSAPLSNCPAFVLGREVLLVDYSGGKLMRYSLDSNVVLS